MLERDVQGASEARSCELTAQAAPETCWRVFVSFLAVFARTRERVAAAYGTHTHHCVFLAASATAFELDDEPAKNRLMKNCMNRNM